MAHQETTVTEYNGLNVGGHWLMHFSRLEGATNIEVSVLGERGGLKARFLVKLDDLQKAVVKLAEEG